jgi:hypothetical protein
MHIQHPKNIIKGNKKNIIYWGHISNSVKPHNHLNGVHTV